MNVVIDHTNFEYYFLLYVDDELNTQERQAMEAFVTKYPETRPLLEELLRTRLSTADPIIFPDKSALFFDQKPISDETLLTYMDGELEDSGIKALLETPTPQLKQRLAGWAQTVAPPDKSVVFPDKKRLYKKTAVLPFNGWKIVAAAVLLLMLGVSFFVQQRNTPLNGWQGIAEIGPDLPHISGVTMNTEKKTSHIVRQPPPLVQLPDTKKVAVVKPDRPEAGIRREIKNHAAKPAPTKTAEPALPSPPAIHPPVATVQTEAKKEATVQTPAKKISEQNKQSSSAADQEMVHAKPVKEKKSLFKKLTQRIEEKVSDTFTDADGRVTVAGFAFNVK